MMSNYKINTFILLGALAAGLLGLQACDRGADGETGTLEVRMHDRPASYDQIMVNVERVEVHRQSGEQQSGWRGVEVNETYDLLELVDGNEAILGQLELEPGTYRQIRLILGDGNQVVIDGDPHNMIVPSGAETGLKLNIDMEIESGFQYTLFLDFDAHRSVVDARGRTGVGAGFLLRPVIKAYTQATTGNIAGEISPQSAAETASVYAIQDFGTNEADTLATSGANGDGGGFLLRGLADGTYTVAAEADGYEEAVRENIEVNIGETNDIGTIDMQESSNN